MHLILVTNAREECVAEDPVHDVKEWVQHPRLLATTAPWSSTTACPSSATLGVLHFAEKTTKGNNKTRTAITSANEL